ncbi:MAG TPA: glycosyltransferase family 2 protein [Dongiaceae bacterium]|jgi:glycosyltransferase involved in cell wall biosynthesis|nr:glycosyltransferase family 2 protein [Dongiaceae bacterium]
MNGDGSKGDGSSLISIVAPAYNEEGGLTQFALRVDAVMRSSASAYEIVFINDGSTDETLSVMRSLRATNPNITIVNLSRNFGKETAMTAGIAHAIGDAIVIIDTDLQDPPELIPEMIDGWRAGYDVVYAQRTGRAGETWMKKTTARLFYWTVKHMGPVPIPENTGDFRLMSRRAARALLQIPERHRFMKGLYAWIGYPQKAIAYRREARFTGRSKWNYWQLWNLAIEGITSFTIVPLKLATYLGFLIALTAFAYGLFMIFKVIVFGEVVRGFPTLLSVVLLLGGVQLIVLGFIGEYLGRIFDETKQRPLYLLESVSWSAAAEERTKAPSSNDVRTPKVVGQR